MKCIHKHRTFFLRRIWNLPITGLALAMSTGGHSFTSRNQFQELMVAYVVKKLSDFMKTEDSLLPPPPPISLDPNRKQLNPIRTSHLSTINFNIIPSSMPNYPK
jgi:hypothetical protein